VAPDATESLRLLYTVDIQEGRQTAVALRPLSGPRLTALSSGGGEVWHFGKRLNGACHAIWMAGELGA
jgi:hypothetical protein